MRSNKQMMIMLALVGAVLAVGLVVAKASILTPTLVRPAAMHETKLVKRSMHNHLSKKVFDRACAASKDTIDEIIGCLTSNEQLVKVIKADTASSCYKEAYGVDFDPKETMKHKDLICNNRDRFEVLTSCVYRKTAEVSDTQQMQKLTEVLVDVGLCIVNALDS